MTHKIILYLLNLTTQLSAVCVISIISYRHITIFEMFIACLDLHIVNVHYLWPCVKYIQKKRLHIYLKHFVINFHGIIFWLLLFNLCMWTSYLMILLVIFPNIPKNLPDLHWPAALPIRFNFITDMI